MILADINLGEVLWSLMVIFFMVIYFMIIFSIFGDLFRSKDMSGLTKALWVLFIFVFIFVGPFVYLIVRGSGMSERALAAQSDAQRQVQDYAQTVVAQTGGGSPGRSHCEGQGTARLGRHQPAGVRGPEGQGPQQLS